MLAEVARRFGTGYSRDASDFFPEARPCSDQFFQTGALVKLHPAFSEWKPVVHGPRHDVLRDIYHPDNRAAFVWELPLGECWPDHFLDDSE